MHGGNLLPTGTYIRTLLTLPPRLVPYMIPVLPIAVELDKVKNTGYRQLTEIKQFGRGLGLKMWEPFEC